MSEYSKLDRYDIEATIQCINKGEIPMKLDEVNFQFLKNCGFGMHDKDLFYAIQTLSKDVQSLLPYMDTHKLLQVMQNCTDLSFKGRTFSVVPIKTDDNLYWRILSTKKECRDIIKNFPHINLVKEGITVNSESMGDFISYMAQNNFDVTNFVTFMGIYYANPNKYTFKPLLKPVDYRTKFVEKDGLDNEDLGLIYFGDNMPVDVLDGIEEIANANANSLKFKAYYTRDSLYLVVNLNIIDGVVEYLDKKGYTTTELFDDIEKLRTQVSKSQQEKEKQREKERNSVSGLADKYIKLHRLTGVTETRLFDASIPLSKSSAEEYADALAEMKKIEEQAKINPVLKNICDDTKRKIIVSCKPMTIKNPRNHKTETYYRVALSSVSAEMSQVLNTLDECLDKNMALYTKKSLYCILTLLKGTGHTIENEEKFNDIFSKEEMTKLTDKVLDINLLGNLVSIRVLGLPYVFKLLFHTSYDIEYNPIFSFFTVTTRQFTAIYNHVKELNSYNIIDNESCEKFDKAYSSILELQEKLNTIQLIDTSHLEVPPKEGQIEVAKQMLHLKHYILSDKTGLGKTKITSLVCESVVSQFPEAQIIIVVPATIKINWVREIKEVNPNAKIQLITAGDVVNEKCNYHIINYDILSRYFTELVALKPFVTVIDEAHNCNAINATTGTPNSIRAEKALGLCKVSHMSYPITATPLRNKVWDVFPLLKMIDHELGDSYSAFKKKYVSGDGDAINIKDLHQKISTHLSRRTGDYQIPERIYMPVKVDLNIYHSLVDDFMEKGNYTGAAKVLVMICALKKYLAYAKIDATYEMGLNILQKERQVVIFTDYTKVIEDLTEKFESNGFYVTRITGKETLKQKQQNIDDFTAGIYDVIFCNRKAGGVGCNLQVAHTVIFNDLFWVPDDVIQAEGRINRYGQTHAVKSIFLYCDEAFIDARLQEVMEHKLAMSESVIDGLDDFTFNTSLYKDVANDFCAKLGIVNIKDDGKMSALNIKDLLDKYDTDSELEVDELDLGLNTNMSNKTKEERDAQEFADMLGEFTAMQNGEYTQAMSERTKKFNASRDARKYVASILGLNAGNNTVHDVKVGYNSKTKIFTTIYTLTNSSNNNKLLFMINILDNKYWYSTMRFVDGKYQQLPVYPSIPLNYLTERTDTEKAFRNFLYALEYSKTNPATHLAYVKQFVNYYVNYYKTVCSKSTN